ncbi:MAG: hypothetical protein IPH03_09990 [Tetrasphaera sp.]|nr:hypothetical protein [Tetrasphaera sp.]
MTPTTALIVTRNGGSDVLAVEERTIPDPGPGQALVRVAAAGVNFIDVYQRQGVYRSRHRSRSASKESARSSPWVRVSTWTWGRGWRGRCSPERGGTGDHRGRAAGARPRRAPT